MSGTEPIKKNTDYRLYLDMDGVFVDFFGGVRKIMGGMSLRQYGEKYGEEVARQRYLQAGSKFWADLDWVRGGKELWEVSSRLFERVNILSSAGTTDPTRAAVVSEGKRQWIKKNIPSMPLSNVFIVNGKHVKKEYAAKDSILVDDVAVTIREWNAAGGFGILHQAGDYKKTIEELEDIARPIKLSELAKRFYH